MEKKIDLEYISCQQFVGSTPGPHLLITAGVHGDEYEPVLALLQLIREISSHALKGTLTLVPVTNRSAFRQASRYGSDNLDLARACPGIADGSLTQRVAYEVSELIRQADYYIDLHTGGSAYCLSPLTGYLLHPHQEVLSQQRKMAHAFNLPIVWGTNPNLEGRTLSVARDANVPALYTEFGGGGGTSSLIIEKMVKGCRNVMIALEMVAGPLPKSEVTYTLEDPSENSGFLQILHPSPADGIFEAAVRLGDIVHQGQPIGNVWTNLGQQLAAVAASKSGWVFMLRAIPAVSKGDALGGVLPLNPSQKA